MINETLPESSVHEFRTLLNAIVGFTGILLMKLPGPINADQEIQLRGVQTSAERLLELINGPTYKAVSTSSSARHTEHAVAAEYRRESTCEPRNEKARILYIDDDPHSRRLMVYLLTDFGHEPLTAEDGEQGLAMARLERPDLILCDVQLPMLDGYAVARELKGDPVLRHIPLVAVTAMAPIQESNGLPPLGSFDYVLIKPIHPETLAVQVASFLAGNPSNHLSVGEVRQT